MSLPCGMLIAPGDVSFGVELGRADVDQDEPGLPERMASCTSQQSVSKVRRSAKWATATTEAAAGVSVTALVLMVSLEVAGQYSAGLRAPQGEAIEPSP